MYEELIESPEEILESPAHELEFDDVCLFFMAEDLEVSLLHHHGNLDELSKYLYIIIMNILNNDGIPYLKGIPQIFDNSKEKTANILVNKWITERDDPDGNGIWFRKN